MSPKEPTHGWFDNLDTQTRYIMPDGTRSSYFLTVREYHQHVINSQRDLQRLHNRRQIEILRRQNFIQSLQQQAEAYGPNRPPRQPDESWVEYLERLREGF